MILGAFLPFYFWTAPLPIYGLASIGTAEPNETWSYSKFLPPVGVGTIKVGYNLETGRSSSATITRK